MDTIFRHTMVEFSTVSQYGRQGFVYLSVLLLIYETILFQMIRQLVVVVAVAVAVLAGWATAKPGGCFSCSYSSHSSPPGKGGHFGQPGKFGHSGHSGQPVNFGQSGQPGHFGQGGQPGGHRFGSAAALAQAGVSIYYLPAGLWRAHAEGCNSLLRE